MNTYLIWSHEHSAWWCAGGHGYTNDVKRAGRFHREEALAVCRQAIPGSREVPNELPVSEQDLIDAAILPAVVGTIPMQVCESLPDGAITLGGVIMEDGSFKMTHASINPDALKGGIYTCPECKLLIKFRQDHKVGCSVSGGAGAVNG